MKTAHQTYTERRAEILAQLEELKAELETHAENESKNPTNWGFVGDLGYARETLGDLLKSFRGA